MRSRIQNLKKSGFTPTGAIDGGAFRGEWARDFWSTFPDCPVIFVEPQPHCIHQLERQARTVPGSCVVEAAISDQPGKCGFTLSGSGSAIADNVAGSSITVKKTTITEICNYYASLGHPAPNILKLDLQGHEIEALKGASELGFLELIILEISVLRIGQVPIFTEVDQYLESHGFRLYDLIPQWYRPLDGALWQIDAFYVNRNSPLIASRDWG